MKKFVLLMGLCIALGIVCNYVSASERLIFRYTAQDSEMSRLTLQNPQIKEVYGEIVSISQMMVELEIDGEDYSYRLLPQTTICCNGLLSVWSAVRPVRSGAYFEARILLDESGYAIFINAFYYGEPCVINGWNRDKRKVYLSVYLPDSGDDMDFILANEVRTPWGSDWLTEGQEIFILYNYKQEIRAVFLPE